MKLFYRGKDGGPESHVWGYWLIEWKPVISIALLRLEDGTREAYHSHAFNAISWLLTGKLVEYYQDNANWPTTYWPSLIPIITKRDTFHKVKSVGRSWALTIRGPWATTWHEYLPAEDRHRILTSGRQEVA